ncbi:hypothetical protein DPEC_G00291760 [Dallia pectoralis]|uniref:Uncharacterized protein n=1 Tax=Dallia pectoralis TaxID=75939 RepID=A0ACC2FHT0_DALPE|nr:hypothetical protein DPEC_G00291760 [Dallia pectoralis]
MGLCCDLLGWREGCCCSLRNIAIDSVRVQSTGVGMIRIFPDFSVQVTAAGGGAAGGMPSGPAVGRVPGTTNGNPQNVQGITSYQQSWFYSTGDIVTKHHANWKCVFGGKRTGRQGSEVAQFPSGTGLEEQRPVGGGISSLWGFAEGQRSGVSVTSERKKGRLLE